MASSDESVCVLVVDPDEERREALGTHLGDRFDVVTEPSTTDALARCESADVAIVPDDCADVSPDTFISAVDDHGYACRSVLLAPPGAADDPILRGFDALVETPPTRASVVETVERLAARDAYDAALDELFALCAARATSRTDGGRLPATMTEDDDPLDSRIRDLRATVDAEVQAFDALDFRASFRDVGRE